MKRSAPPNSEPWRLWDDDAHAPAMNMAIDEALLIAAPRGRPVLRFYGWDRAAVSIGYVQRFGAAPAQDCVVVRRPTGGGVVFHDHDFTYSVVLPAGHWLTGLDRTKSYDWINRAVLAGLQRCNVSAALARHDVARSVDRSRMVCFEHPTRYDILMGGRKVAGSAQRRTRTGTLHQGSIHFGGPLPAPRCEVRAALVEGFVHVLHADFEPFVPDAELLLLARQLVASRYGSPSWNRRR